MFTKKILLNLFLTTMVGTTVGLAASWSSSQPSSSSSSGMFPIMIQHQSANYAYTTSNPPHAPQLYLPAHDYSSQPSTTPKASRNRIVNRKIEGQNTSSTAQIRSLNKLDGGEIAVELSRNKLSFILRDPSDKKMGKISVDEVKRIAGNADQFSEIIPLGDLLSAQLFGKIVAKEDEKEFSLVKSEPPIQRLVHLVIQKFEEACDINHICKYEYYKSAQESVERKQECRNYQPREHREIGKKIFKYMLEDGEFTQESMDLLSRTYELYTFGLPCDIESYKEFKKITTELSLLSYYSYSDRLEFSKEIESMVSQVCGFSHRVINLNDIELIFNDRSFDIFSVDKSDDKIKFKISNVLCIVESDIRREYFFEINYQDVKQMIPGYNGIFLQDGDKPSMFFFDFTRSCVLGLNFIPQFNLIELSNKKDLLFMIKWAEGWLWYLNSKETFVTQHLYEKIHFRHPKTHAMKPCLFDLLSNIKRRIKESNDNLHDKDNLEEYELYAILGQKLEEAISKIK